MAEEDKKEDDEKVVDTPEYDAKDDDKRFVLGEN